jgi:hypothetical protein
MGDHGRPSGHRRIAPRVRAAWRPDRSSSGVSHRLPPLSGWLHLICLCALAGYAHRCSRAAGSWNSYAAGEWTGVAGQLRACPTSRRRVRHESILYLPGVDCGAGWRRMAGWSIRLALDILGGDPGSCARHRVGGARYPERRRARAPDSVRRPVRFSAVDLRCRCRELADRVHGHLYVDLSPAVLPGKRQTSERIGRRRMPGAVCLRPVDHGGLERALFGLCGPAPARDPGLDPPRGRPGGVVSRRREFFSVRDQHGRRARGPWPRVLPAAQQQRADGVGTARASWICRRDYGHRSDNGNGGGRRDRERDSLGHHRILDQPHQRGIRRRCIVRARSGRDEPARHTPCFACSSGDVPGGLAAP